MNFPKKTARQFVVVLMVCAMILSGITMPQIVALASDSIDLSSYIVTDGTTDAATAEGENKPSASVLLNLPDNMNDRSELDALGVTGLTVTLTAVNYSAYSGETAGVLAFLQNSTDYAWYDGGSWTALNNGSVSLTMDMSSADWGSGSSVGKIGIQFTNLAEGSTVDYQITSIAFTTSGGGTSGGGGSDPTTDYNYPDIDYNYARLLQYSLYFYDANMCGSEVGEKSLLSWRDDCHTFDRTTYTRSDGSIVNVDLTGGFHDAGDHVKFGLPEAYAAFVLGMSYDTDQSAYEAAKQTGHLKTLTTHFADYFVNCTVLNADGTAVEAFCYQVGQGGGGYDHGYWGAPEAQTNSNRPIHFTGSGDYATDIVSLSAAALAMQYRNFGGDEYLATAEKLFEYARTNDKMTGTYGADFYKSTAWQDDYCLVALLLYKITGKDIYQTEFNKYASDSEAQKGYWPLGWDNVGPAVAYYNGNKTTLANVMNLSDGNSAHDGYRCLSDWGSARYNTSMQYTGLLYDKMTNSSIYKTWAEGQMNFLLGNNSGKQCFIVGYNSFSSKYPHHRAASGYTGGSKGTTTQAHVLLGALVGGQKLDGSYTDSADDYICNEVAIDYNATLVAAAAALYNLNSSDTETQYIDPEYYGGTGESGGSTTEEDKTTTEDKTTEEDKTTTEDKTTE
ncbi:MAG: glycoside hydrolase family 9 protein, partial [Wujia sp.]